MSPGFAFPPPPPPPPPVSAVSDSHHPVRSDRGRGRGRWPTQRRGRGSGPQFPRGGGGRRSADWDRPQHSAGQQPTRQFLYQATQPSYSAGQKRNHGQAFDSRTPVPSGHASPAVPSFGDPFPALAAPAPQAKPAPAPKKKERTYNQLGLTPRTEEHESSEEEDDAGEEQRLAAAIQKTGQGLQFEHKGQLMSLRTPGEIKVWIAERKKRFPTKAKIAEAIAAKAKAQAEAKTKREEQRLQNKQNWQADQKARKEDKRRGGEAQRQKSDKSGARSKSKGTGEDALKALRERALASQQKNRESPANDRKATGREHTDQKKKDDASLGDSTSHDDLDLSSEPSEDEDTSSSGSSDASDSSHEAPHEQSSKVAVPPLKPDTAEPKQRPKARKLCENMLRRGRCPRGKRCPYNHGGLEDGPESGANSLATKPESKAMPLYERLLAQQHDQEDREILRCIIVLGNRGLLEDARQ